MTKRQTAIRRLARMRHAHAHIGPGGITIPAGASAFDALSGRVGQLERKVAAVNPRLPTTDR